MKTNEPNPTFKPLSFSSFDTLLQIFETQTKIPLLSLSQHCLLFFSKKEKSPRPLVHWKKNQKKSPQSKHRSWAFIPSSNPLLFSSTAQKPWSNDSSPLSRNESKIFKTLCPSVAVCAWMGEESSVNTVSEKNGIKKQVSQDHFLG